MAREYKKTLWVNEETPLNASNLNKIEEGIEGNTNDLAAHEADIAKIDEDLKQTKIDLAETKETFESFKEETNNTLANINPDAFKSIFDVENSDDYDTNKVIYEVPRFYKGTLPCDTVSAVPVETINITWLDDDTTLGLILLALMVDGSIYSPDNFCWPDEDAQSFEDSFNIFTFNNGEEGLELCYSYDEENGPYVELYLFTLEYNGVIWDSNNGWNRSSPDEIHIYEEVEFDSGSKLFGDLLSNTISLNDLPNQDEGRDYYVLGYNGWVKLNGCDTIGITPSIQNILDINLVDDVYSAQILEVPYMFKGKFSFPFNVNGDYDTLVNVGKVYINKQLDRELVNNLLAYALLVDERISSVAPFRFQKYKEDGNSDKAYFLDYETEEDYYSFILAYDETNGYLELSYHTPSVGDWILFDSNTGWLDDCPDYIEFNHDMAPFESSLFFAILSNIFSFEPFEQNEDLYSIGCDYFVRSNECWWQKLNGEASSASSVNAFVDVESLTTRQGGTAIPQTGKVDAIYFNTSLFNEEIINIISKLEVGETMPQYYIFVSDDMSLMLYVGIQAQPTSELGEIDSNATYYISFVFQGNDYIIWNSENGWDPNEIWGSILENGFNFGLELGLDSDVNLITPEGLVSSGFPADGHCGDQNDLLVSIVSTEKGNFEYTESKEVAVGDKDKVYRAINSKGEYSYHQIKNDEWEHFGGNIIPVDKLSDVEKLVGTTITKCENAGPVEIYINKTLTNEQVQELCSKIYYDNIGRYFVSGHFGCMGFVMIGNASLEPTSIQGDIQHNYQIFAYDYNTDEEIKIWSTGEGWSSNCPDSVTIDTNLPMETSVEPLSEEDAEEFVGKYNSLIKDLLSATPFKIGVDKKAIYRVKEEKESKVVKSALPAGDSGTTFDKIYLNMNLSPEEMLKIFQSVEYRALSYDYKNHYIIHSLRHPDPNNTNSLMFQYTLQIIQLSGTQYNLVLSEWIYGSSDTKYILCSYDNGVVEWASDISNFVNSDGSLKTKWVGNKFWDEEYAGELGDSIGSENYQLIDLIYLQSTEEAYDYSYYQYTSNGWEIYGVGVISVKELPSIETPSEYIPVPNEGEICKITWNQSISQEQLLTLLKGLPEEFWKDKDGNETPYYIFDLKVIWNGDPTVYSANANIYLRRESNSDGTYTYYLGGRDGSTSFTIFRISEYEGWIWDYQDYINLLNNIFDNQANNNGQWYFMSEDLDGGFYKNGHYNHLLTDLVYANNPEYDPNYKQAISQTVLYRVDTNGKSKYYNFNGTKWTEVGSGAGSSEESKVFTFSGKPALLNNNLVENLCGIEITDQTILNGIKDFLSHKALIQVNYENGFDISKSSHLLSTLQVLFTMEIITVGGVPDTSGQAVAILGIDGHYFYCDTDFWNTTDSAPIDKTIELEFKFVNLTGSTPSDPEDTGISKEERDAIIGEANAYTDKVKQELLGEGISETFDTLKEIQDWIEGDGVNATELTQSLANKQDKLTSGYGISIDDNGVISLNIPVAETEEY